LVLERIGSSLAPRGVVYVEDYCVGRPVSDENRRDLLLTISCPGLQNRDEYFAAFGEAGIVVKPEDIHDTTGEWGRLAKNRHREFVSDFEGIVGRYGTQTARDALSLYESVARLFERGIIQGLRFVGTKVPKD